MDHAAEGTLQAYLDGEIGDAAAAAVRDHVEACTACAAELDALRQASGRVSEALAVLERPAPMMSARAAIARARRPAGRRLASMGAWGLAKAAMLLLVLAGATAAAIPDVRRALETTISRVAAMFGGGQVRDVATPAEPMPAEPAAAQPEESETFVAPANGRVQIVMHSPAEQLEVVVRLVDEEQAQVRTSTMDGPVRLRVGTGRLELTNLGAGTVTIGIPRTVRSATVEIDGATKVYKQGSELRAAGPDVESRGNEVRFTTGS